MMSLCIFQQACSRCLSCIRTCTVIGRKQKECGVLETYFVLCCALCSVYRLCVCMLIRIIYNALGIWIRGVKRLLCPTNFQTHSLICRPPLSASSDLLVCPKQVRPAEVCGVMPLFMFSAKFEGRKPGNFSISLTFAFPLVCQKFYCLDVGQPSFPVSSAILGDPVTVFFIQRILYPEPE